MDVPEPDLLAWVMGSAATPAEFDTAPVPPDVRVPRGARLMAKARPKSPAELLVPAAR